MRESTTYERFCGRMNAWEDWLIEQPAVVSAAIVISVVVGGFMVLAFVIWAFIGVSDGPSCAPGYSPARIESEEMVLRGKVRVPGTVIRWICVP